MSIEEEKLDLIKWLLEVDDDQVIRQFRTLQKSNEDAVVKELSKEERAAIEQGLKSIEQGKTLQHDEVKRLTAEKFPHLFQ
ncbi:MAG: hypothetical protein RIB71_25580 [Imperialibacter sp.]|uniref:hypothetical protein n=1 Tax=Imperialibacter sp. TaxID=2038411 RepID=UPI0032ED8396